MKIEVQELSSLITAYSSAEQALASWYDSSMRTSVDSCSSLKELTELWDQILEVCCQLGLPVPSLLHVEYVLAANRIKHS